jgi:hypothetical protein
MTANRKVRKSVPLTHEDEAHLKQLRTPGTPEHQALSQIAGILLPDDASEAETLHALLMAGRAAVTERVMISGYAALAASRDDEDHATHRAMRARAAHLGD